MAASRSSTCLWTSPPVRFHCHHFPSSFKPKPEHPPLRSTKMQGSEVTEEANKSSKKTMKKIFVAGARGSTGKRVVEKLLARGFQVKAGVRDVDKAKTTFSMDNPSLQIVKADVTDGSAKLAEAIGDDSDAVICATGFKYGWDLLAPWKVDYSGTVNLVEACRKRDVDRFILVSSILVNGAAMGQILNPAYIFLNIFGLTGSEASGRRIHQEIGYQLHDHQAGRVEKRSPNRKPRHGTRGYSL